MIKSLIGLTVMSVPSEKLLKFHKAPSQFRQPIEMSQDGMYVAQQPTIGFEAALKIQRMHEKGEASQPGEWYCNATQEHKGTVLLVHGLNTQVKRLSEWASYYNERGYDVFVPHLKGHASNYKLEAGLTVEEARINSFGDAKADDWRADVKRSLAMLQDEEGEVILAGYSMGGLLLSDAVSSGTVAELGIENPVMVLLAPGIKNKWKTSFMGRHLTGFEGWMDGKTDGIVESTSTYPENWGEPVAAIESYFTLLDSFHEALDAAAIERLKSVPTHIFVDKNDALISAEKIKCMIKDFEYWELNMIERADKNGSTFHDVLSETVMGEALWDDVQYGVSDFLDRHKK